MSNNITATLKTLIESQAALGALVSTPLPAKTSFRVGKIARAVESEIKDYDTARIALCKRYGTLNEKENQYELGENKEVFDTELNALADEKIEIPHAPVLLEHLGEVPIAAAHLIALEWMIAD